MHLQTDEKDINGFTDIKILSRRDNAETGRNSQTKTIKPKLWIWYVDDTLE